MFSDEDLVRGLTGLIGAEHVVAGSGTIAYAVDGRVPRAVSFPGSVEEVSAIMAFALAERLKVVPWGSGTKMAFGGIPERVDLVLVLSRLNGVVDHEPADMIATFQAGILLKEVQGVLSRCGQFISLDPPHADLATVGGILATGSAGPRRLRYGASRDLVVAVRIVHPGGKITKGGAKVVKNVTGYDMSKLYVGSLGTLGIIVEATFRLYPIPAVEKSCLASFASIEAAGKAAARILDSPLVPSAVEILNPEASRRVARRAGLPWPEESYGLAVALGSVRQEAVDFQLRMVEQLFGDAGSRESYLLEGQAHDAFWKATRDFALGSNLQVVLKASVLLTKVAQGVRLGEEVAAKQGLSLGVVSEAGSGIIRYYLAGETASPERFQKGVINAVGQLRAFVRETEGSLVVLEAPPTVKSNLDVWGPAGKAFPIMQGLKEQFDPARVLNPGRFIGGI